MAKPVRQLPAAPQPPLEQAPIFAEREILNWTDFSREIEPYLDCKHIFRGVADARLQLVPSVGRNSETWTYSPELELELLEEFKREAIPYLSRTSHFLDDWAWLALAQHHGVPTRLLDWSESPHVALFFAVWGSRENEGKDAAVYIIHQPTAASQFKQSPLAVKDSSFFYPRHITSRITSQSGLFTIQPDPLVPYDGGRVIQLIIKASAKADLRKKLDAVGVHDASIFADLDGLCRRLRFQWQHPPKPPGIAGTGTDIPPLDPNDPQRGRWGGLSENKDWKLLAKVDESPGSKNWFRIVLSVESKRRKKLAGEFIFHLHHTFPQSVRQVTPEKGKVELKLWSYGAFTVGVELPDKGSLELNLAELPDAPNLFKGR